MWQDSWDYSDTSDFYGELQPMVSYKLKRLMRPRHKDVQITRRCFGHVRLGQKLCEIGQRPDPHCRVRQVPEDVQHFLMIGPVQKQLHDRLRKNCKGNKRPYNLKTILTTDSCTDIVYDFIKETGHLL